MQIKRGGRRRSRSSRIAGFPKISSTVAILQRPLDVDTSRLVCPNTGHSPTAPRRVKVDPERAFKGASMRGGKREKAVFG